MHPCMAAAHTTVFSAVKTIQNSFLVQLQGPSIMPFTLEKENLILGLWQLQQAGQDFRIKEVLL